MPSSSTTSDREAAKARVRAKVEAREQMTAREYLANLLHATNTHADAEAILDLFERQSDTAARLNRVMDICDREQRNAMRWENPIPVPEWVAEVQRAALGDDVRKGGATS
jgi:Uma2 family endonuclease